MVGVTGGHSRKRVLFGSADRRPWSSGRDRSLEVAMVLAATIGLIGSVAGSIPLTNAQTDSTPQPPTVASLMDAARAAGRSSDWAAALPPLLQAERMLGQQATAANPATLVTLHQAIATAAWHQKRYELVVEHCQRLLTLLPAGSQATPVDAERIAAVRQMLVRSLARSGQLNRAVVELQPLANGPASAQAFVVDQAMAMAAGALTTGQPNVAISAY